MLPGKQYTPTDYAAMALRWRWVILTPFLLGGYIALIISSRLPNSYESDMLIQVIPQRIPPSFVQTTVTMRTVDRLGALTEQIMSRTELERLITEMDLYKEERERLPMQDVVEYMRRQLKVDPVLNRDRDADSFYVRFSYSEPGVARRVTERLGGLFIDVNQQDRGNLAQATQSFLQSALADSKAQLETTEAKLRAFREKNAGRLPTQLTYNMQAMQNSQMRIQALVESTARDRDRRLLLERMYADAQAEVIIPSPAPAASATQTGETVVQGTTAQQLALAKQTLVGFELRLKPEHPDVVRTKSLISRLEAQLAAETKAAEEARLDDPVESAPIPIDQREVARRDRLKQMEVEIESLDRQIARRELEEQGIRESLDAVQRRIEQVPGLESEWIALTRDYETQSAKYKELLGKSETAQLASNLEQRQIGEQFKILDPARTPVRPTGVNRLQLNAMGAAIGLGVGLFLAGLLEVRDRTFRQADDIVEVLKLPVIALVPRVITTTERRRERMKRRLASAAAAVLVLAGGYGFWVMKLWNFVV